MKEFAPLMDKRPKLPGARARDPALVRLQAALPKSPLSPLSVCPSHFFHAVPLTPLLSLSKY